MSDTDPQPIKGATPAAFQAVASLVTQLAFSASPFSRADLETMLADPATTINATRARSTIVSIITLVGFPCRNRCARLYICRGGHGDGPRGALA